MTARRDKMLALLVADDASNTTRKILEAALDVALEETPDAGIESLTEADIEAILRAAILHAARCLGCRAGFS